jgi:hypothetical protein
MKGKKAVTMKGKAQLREQGCNSELWSDGEHRIVDELMKSSWNSHRFNLDGEQILCTYNPITTPKKGDIVMIDKLTYVVKSVMLEITTSQHSEFNDGIDYNIEIERQEGEVI